MLNIWTYDWFFHGLGMFGVFAFALDWLGYGKCKAHQHPNLSPEIKQFSVKQFRRQSHKMLMKKQNRVYTYFSIALGIFKQIKDEFCWFDRPPSLAIRVSTLCLGCPSNTTTETSEWNGLFVGKNIFQVPFSLIQGQLPDCKRSFPSVLQVQYKRQSYKQVTVVNQQQAESTIECKVTNR